VSFVFLSIEQVLRLHQRLIETSGGSLGLISPKRMHLLMETSELALLWLKRSCVLIPRD
jgi:hypothetical protein